MSLEIKIDNRTAKVKLLEKDGTRMKVQVDQRVYDVDVAMVEDMVYSLIYEGRSYNIEMIQASDSFSYYVNSLHNSYHVEIMEGEHKLKSGRSKDDHSGDVDTVVTPMPAKIVKIPVAVGEKVTKGQTVIIVSAMKMEMEFKAGRDGVIKKINVKEEDTVNVHEVLVELE